MLREPQRKYYTFKIRTKCWKKKNNQRIKECLQIKKNKTDWKTF